MLEGIHGPLVYAAILIAAIVEGEVAYVAAAALVAHGRLNPLGVMLAGAAGAAIGDQLYFYVLRGRLARWVGRFPSIERRARPLVARVRRHESAMVLMIRFAPGLRIAIAAACAYAEVPPLKFSILNSVTALVWSVVLMALIAWVGPTYLAAYGLDGWKGALLVGVLIIVLFRAAGWLERRALASTG
ncbi:MAG: VTT domain-containing protein [Acidobacteriota bacterium]